MKFVRYLISFSPLLFFANSLSQDLTSSLISDFENIRGLPIVDIKQDNTGFLWVGTTEGLYRYNGYNFKLYEHKDKFIGSSVIRTLHLDRLGELWIGTEGGLLHYSKITDQLESFRHDSTDNTSIHGDVINN